MNMHDLTNDTARLVELRGRLNLYHEIAAYYVPSWAQDAQDAWGDVVEMVDGLIEQAERESYASEGQLPLFEAEGGWL